MKNVIVLLLFFVSGIYAYVGPEHSNFEGETRLLETDYRLGVHIPQQDNHGVVLAVVGTGIDYEHEAFSDTHFVAHYDTVLILPV